MEEREVLRVNEYRAQWELSCGPIGRLHEVRCWSLFLGPSGRWSKPISLTNDNQFRFTAPVADLAVGSTFHHAVPNVNTGSVKEKYLLQVGVLKLTLRGTVGPRTLLSSTW